MTVVVVNVDFNIIAGEQWTNAGYIFQLNKQNAKFSKSGIN
ncbi:MAG: hypothetical protein WBE68_11415 [Candidatus Nitrosopolaris sp.]